MRKILINKQIVNLILNILKGLCIKIVLTLILRVYDR